MRRSFPFNLKKKIRLLLALHMRGSGTTISEGGGVEFEFFRGRPDPSHDLFRSAHVSHIYIFL